MFQRWILCVACDGSFSGVAAGFQSASGCLASPVNFFSKAMGPALCITAAVSVALDIAMHNNHHHT